MATNDFLPFAGGAGANVLTQADYEALAARTPGFSSGILLSENLNKVLRQGTVMASVLAQWIADNSGDNVVDDGTTTTIEASLTKAMTALLGAGGTTSSDYITIPFKDKTTGVRRNLIIQWGGGTTISGGSATITFPIAFPNAVLSYGGTIRGQTTNANSYVSSGSGSDWTTTGGKFWTNLTTSGVGFNWYAVGY